MSLQLFFTLKIFLVLLGATLGSFLNVLIYRLPRGYSVAMPERSICPACLTPLKPLSNLPIISYIAQRGRCAHCGSKISGRYPLVEALCAVLFLAVFSRFGFEFEALLGFLLVLILLPIIFIDLDFYIIPDELNFIGGAIALALRAYHGTLWEGVLGGLAGFFSFWLLAKSYSLIKGRDGLGFGDVKMLAMLGCFLGPVGVLISVAVSSVLGAVIGVTLMIIRRESLKMAIPYGPFLAAGGFFALFWREWFYL